MTSSAHKLCVTIFFTLVIIHRRHTSNPFGLVIIFHVGKPLDSQQDDKSHVESLNITSE